MKPSLPLLPLLGIGLALSVPAHGEVSAEHREFFESKIRPILVEHCLECHSVESGKQKGGLLLDSKWAWETGGDSGPAVKPGDAEGSLLIAAVRRKGKPVEPMPPKSALPPEQIALLEQWIAAGAPDPRPKVENGDSLVEAFDLEKRRAAHWCWQPVGAVPTPSVGDATWPASMIDAFILSRIEDAGLRPAVPADPRTLTRRLFLDLIGLPPTPGDLARFDVDGTGFDPAKVVDHLLASPRFGEKWARHWMDLVRYAETCGHEFDYEIPNAWRYRDYLIRAYNADLPYDAFIREHLAGDLLPEPRRHPEDQTNESILATGFWYFHEAVHAPTDVLLDEAERMDNQIDVFGKAFQGLTIACARCHDHKFDAISTSDYYALTGFLQGSCRTDAPVDRGRVRETTAAAQRALRREAEPLLADLPAESSPGTTFLAALSLVRQAREQAAASAGEADLVIADFEGGYDGWTITGDAFGAAPATGTFPGQQKVSGFLGKGLVNSWNGSDGKTGSALSPEFTLHRPYLSFLIGGGSHPETRAELLVEGKPVHTASGKNHEALEPASWDVSAFLGKPARIRLVDEHRGGWGHLNVDHFVLTHHPALPGASTAPTETEIARVAAAQGLDTAALAAWCRLLTDEPASPKAADAFWNLLARQPDQLPRIAAETSQTREALQRFRSESELLADFSGGDLPQGWSTTGEAWAATGDRPGASFLAGHPISLPGTVSSGFLGASHTGTLRSPTFSIRAPQIHIRSRSEQILVRVVPDSYHMAVYSQLLFRNTIRPAKDTDTGGQFRWITLDGDLVKYLGHRAYLEFADAGPGHGTISEIRLSHGPKPPEEAAPWLDRLLADGEPPAHEDELAHRIDAMWREAAERFHEGGTADAEILDWFLGCGLVSAPALESIVARGADLAAKLPVPEFALAMVQGTPENAFVSIRGTPHNRGEEVPNRFLTALGGQTGTRLDLANAVAAPDNPLTSRVLVNRLWHHLFGRGLAPTVDDFGPMGQAPSHPELLDWLARDFMDHGWSVKHTLREIVLSSTYRQSSVPHPVLAPALLATADPSNLLLHHMPVRRLPAEAIRDSILSVSGRLDPTPFGPSIPTHRTDFMTGRGARGSGPLDGAGRRSVYLSIYRNFLNPLLLAFDMPNPFGPKGRRGTSNVPAQALALLNDPFVLEQARHWAAQEPAAPGEARLIAMTERALGRPPRHEELRQLREFLGAEPGPEAWADVAHILFNTKDFLYVR